MWKTCVIIVLVVIGFFGLLFVWSKKSTEDYSTNREKKGVPPKPHGIDTKHYPKFPREMNSEFHHDILKETLTNLGKCGDCEELEQKLLQDGINGLEQLEKSRYVKPDLQTKYSSYMSCDMCKMLLQTWDRYLTILENMSNYIYDKKLPTEPKIVNMRCAGCNDIQKKDKEYADNLKKELECRVSGDRYCRHVKFTGGEYKYDKNCPDCVNVYNTWQMYIFSIIALINYYRFGKQNLKPIA